MRALISYLSILSYLSLMAGNGNSGFTQNKGQIHDQFRRPTPTVLYLLNGPGMNVQLKRNGFAYDTYSVEEQPVRDEVNGVPAFDGRSSANGLEPSEVKNRTYQFHRVDIRFVNGDPNATIVADGESEDYTNYYTDVTGEAGAAFVRSYSTVTYSNVWPNIDVRFNCTEAGFKYDVIVRPGGDLSDARFKVEGAAVSEDLLGRLVFVWAEGSMEELIPDSWVERGRKRDHVTARYRIIEPDVFGFSVHSKPEGTLVVDPQLNLNWATFYGGTGAEQVWRTGLDVQGNAYLCGSTWSSSSIATTGAFDSTLDIGPDGFLVKFNAAGARIYGTYFGGSDSDYAQRIAVHDAGYTIIGGGTRSLTGMATTGAHQTVHGGGDEAFMAKFSLSGQRIWCTYYGGAGSELLGGLDIGSDESIAFCGTTNSTNNIALPNADQYALSGPQDGFAGRFSSNGGRIWASYVGGTASDGAYDIAFLGTLSVGITGFTNSANRLAKAVAGTADITWNGGKDAYLARYSESGAKLWATYHGGPADDYGHGIAYGDLNKVVICGATQSTSGMATPGAAQPNLGGESDAFVASFTVSNGVKLWSTYNGGPDLDSFNDVAKLASGYSIVVGHTKPPTTGPIPGPHTYCIYSSAGALETQVQYAFSMNAGDGVGVNGTAVAIATTLSVTGEPFCTPNAYQTIDHPGHDAGLLRYDLVAQAMLPPIDNGSPTGSKMQIMSASIPTVLGTASYSTIMEVLDQCGRSVYRATGEDGSVMPSLIPGIYMVVRSDAQGNRSTTRFFIP